jgi:hypothetical protein
MPESRPAALRQGVDACVERIVQLLGHRDVSAGGATVGIYHACDRVGRFRARRLREALLAHVSTVVEVLPGSDLGWGRSDLQDISILIDASSPASLDAEQLARRLKVVLVRTGTRSRGR